LNSGKEVVSKEELEKMFGNIEDIKNLSKKLLGELKREVEASTSGYPIGRIFLEFVSQLCHALCLTMYV
jgi:hypothetical protein